jgi:hypothetical protein
MKNRVLVSVLCVCTLLAAIGLPGVAATAADQRTVTSPSLRWANVNSIKLGMSLSGGKVTSEGTVTGYSGTTAITAAFTLEKLINGKYEYVDSWSSSSSTMLLSCSRSTSNCTSGTYKLSISGTATRNGVIESFADWLIKSI